jgi:phosphoribosylamine--glycine ligase
MNVLIIGNGGREHALGWKIKQSKKCGRLFFAPGNGGTSSLGENVPLVIDPVNTQTADAIDYFCRHNKVELIVIGPEDPLSQGLADRLQKPGRFVFGPNAAAARLEGDKAYAKDLMRAAAIPTAESRKFTDIDAAFRYIEAREEKVVVKAAGLCKGKGVVVCDNNDDARAAVKMILEDKTFGDAGATVIIEERLTGQELSVLALTDGRDIYVLEPAQDHKQAHDGDTGPNTGGMGAYTPTPLATDDVMAMVDREVLVPVIDAMRRDRIDYRGVLYAGLMLTAGGPKVLEFNCRFGDPEVQPLMMRLKGDMIDIMCAVADGRAADIDLSWDPRCCCCVVMASGGYPGDYQKGKPITGIDEAMKLDDVMVFQAGTTKKDGKLVTDGGRVLSVCAMGDNLKDAQQKANSACELIHFDGAFYRHDIGYRVM